MICFVFWIDERLASAYKHTPCFISYPIESFFPRVIIRPKASPGWKWNPKRLFRKHNWVYDNNNIVNLLMINFQRLHLNSEQKFSTGLFYDL